MRIFLNEQFKNYNNNNLKKDIFLAVFSSLPQSIHEGFTNTAFNVLLGFPLISLPYSSNSLNLSSL